MIATALPLQDIKVLDMTRLFAGPFATQTFGDFGAEVFKIERPGRGDEFRHYGPPFLSDADGNPSPRAPEGCGYLSVNRNKKSLTIDFSRPEGADLIREMARTCDVFIENYKVGTMARYGLDFGRIKAVNPNIIYLSVTGFGQDGPYASRPGTDIVFQAMSGLMSVTGDADGLPTRSGVVMSDMLAGFNATIALLIALRRRDQGGEGAQYIDVSLLDASIAAMSTRAMHYFLTGETPMRSGDRIATSVPAQMFECQDGLLTVQASTDPDFAKLCEVLGRPAWAHDPDYQTRAARVRHADVLIPMLSERFATDTVQAWYAALVAVDIICSPVYAFDQVMSDPQVVHRKVATTVPHPTAGEIRLLTNPIRLSGAELSYTPPPGLGEHTEAVLSETFGLTPERLSALHASGIL